MGCNPKLLLIVSEAKECYWELRECQCVMSISSVSRFFTYSLAYGVYSGKPTPVEVCQIEFGHIAYEFARLRTAMHLCMI